MALVFCLQFLNKKQSLKQAQNKALQFLPSPLAPVHKVEKGERQSSFFLQSFEFTAPYCAIKTYVQITAIRGAIQREQYFKF
jgi:hypothetical protein